MRKVRQPTEEEFIEAYARHGSDIEAATALGIHRLEFAMWRNRNGKPSRSAAAKHGSTLSEEEEARRLKAYSETGSDREAAKRLGLPRVTFRQWRTMRGLPSKASKTVKALSAEENQRRLEAYNTTRSDKQASRKLGISAGAFNKWRRYAHLPAHHDRGPGDPLRAIKLRYYQRVRTDEELAARVGQRTSSITYWRKAQNLKPKSLRGKPLTAEEWARRREVILASDSAAAAAKALGISRSQVLAAIRILKIEPAWRQGL